MKLAKLLTGMKKGMLAPEFIIGLVIIAIVMIVIILFLARAQLGIEGQTETITNILGLD